MALLSKLVIASLHLIPKPVMRQIAARYIAGDRLQDAVERCRLLSEQGHTAMLDLLGEDTRSEEEAQGAVAGYLQALEARCEAGLDAYLSIKPTQFGLRLSRELCERNYRRVLEAAEARGVFVRVEMEDHTTTEDTIAVFERLRRDHEHVGIVIQVCLRRSLRDLHRLLDGEGKGRLNVRLVKGIYIEPFELAYREPQIVTENFRRASELLLGNGAFVGVATHDERVVFDALEVIDRLGLGVDDYEFQMLLGVRDELRAVLRAQGLPVRVYVPYGPEWRAYSLRRLRYNPTILRHVIRQTLRGGR